MAVKTDVHNDLDIGTVIKILELVASKKVTVNEKLDRPAGRDVYVCVDDLIRLLMHSGYGTYIGE